jgi:hypothetical protein
MSDVRRLLVIKANLETAMQRDLAPHIRAFAQQELDAVCKQIEEAREELDRLFEPQEIDQIKARVSELEASNAGLLDSLEVARDFIQQGIELGCISTECAGAELNMDSIDEMLDKFEEAIKKAKGELQ